MIATENVKPVQSKNNIAIIALDGAVLLAILILNAVVLIIKGTERFEFSDMSGILDGGYRVSIGQRSYVDFFSLAGPIHLYMHALFFKLFGFTSTAVMIHLCTVGLAATVIVYTIARLHLRLVPSALFAVLTSFAFYGPICHPWYDQNATIWLMIGILIWELRLKFWNERKLDHTACVCGALTALSFLTKSNVGLAGGLLFFCLFLSGPRKCRSIIFYILGGMIAAGVVILPLNKPCNFIEQNFFAWGPTQFGIRARLTNFVKLYDVWNSTPNATVLFVIIIVGALGGKKFIFMQRSRLSMLGGLVFAGMFTAWTTSYTPRANLTWNGLQFVNLALLVHELPLEKFGLAQKRVKTVLSFLIAVITLINLRTAAQYTADLLVWTWNPWVQVSDYVIKTDTFRGWQCNRATGAGMDKTVEFARKNIPANQTLFVLPDVTMIYGLTGHDSYRKCPCFFCVNEILRGRWYDEFREHFLTEPPEWIVLHDAPRPSVLAARPVIEWLKLGDTLERKYSTVWHYGEFSILRRRLVLVEHPLKNADFAVWPSAKTAAPGSWLVGGDGPAEATREITSASNSGQANLRFRHLSGGAAAIYQDISGWERFKGGSIEMSCRVNSNRPNSVSLAVSDGLQWLRSAGNERGGEPGMLWLSGPISPTATALRVHLYITDGATASIGPVRFEVTMQPASDAKATR